MPTIVFIAMLIALVILHELEHAKEMRKRGVEIQSAGFEIPIITLFTIHKPWFFSGIPFKFSPFPYLAYVLPSEKGIETIKKLPYRDMAMIYGAGPWGSFFYPLPILMVISIFQQEFMMALLYAALIPALWFGKNIFCKYGVLIIGSIFTVLFAVYIYKTGLSNLVSADAGHSTPANINRATEKMTVITAIAGACDASFCLAALNCILSIPLDGGRVFKAFLHAINSPKWITVTLSTIPAFLIISFLLMNIGSDLIGTIKWFMSR